MNVNKKYIVREIDDSRVYTGEDSIEHVLYEGDNLHGLELLQESHVGKIDVIYIDPPYNTGNTGFIYNDKFEITEDGNSHSGWLSFMNKRLRLARELMTDDGVMFISIDDNEQARLRLLCDQIFGEDRVETYIWDVNDITEGSMPKTASNTVRKEHEYLITCFKKYKSFNKYKDLVYENSTSFSNPDNDTRGDWMSGNISRNGIKSTTGSKYFEIINPAGTSFKRNWTISKSEYSQLVDDNRLWFGLKGAGVPRIKIFRDEPKEVIPSSIFRGLHSSKTGSSTLRDLGIDGFDFPKPTKLIKRLLDISVGGKNATVLDFFAGSGTTAHAVMELNEEDGGRRRTILMNNNEINSSEEEDFIVEKGYVEPFTGSRRGTKKHRAWLKKINDFKGTEEYKELAETDEYKNLGVARRVTRERVRKVIEGYTTPRGKIVDGLGGNNFRHYVVAEKEVKENEQMS